VSIGTANLQPASGQPFADGSPPAGACGEFAKAFAAEGDCAVGTVKWTAQTTVNMDPNKPNPWTPVGGPVTTKSNVNASQAEKDAGAVTCTRTITSQTWTVSMSALDTICQTDSTFKDDAGRSAACAKSGEQGQVSFLVPMCQDKKGDGQALVDPPTQIQLGDATRVAASTESMGSLVETTADSQITVLTF
jgi:hypothetical protein